MVRPGDGYYDSRSKVKLLLLDVSNDFTYSPVGAAHNMIHPPLGIMTISSYLRSLFTREQLSVQCIDVAIEGGYDEMMKLVREKNPDIVGIRALSHSNEQFHETARRIREWRKEVAVIGGGPYANASPDLIIQDPSFDAVCLAEGEYVMRDIVQLFLDGGTVRDLGGGSVKRKAHSTISTTGGLGEPVPQEVTKDADGPVAGIHYRVDGQVVQNPPMPQVPDLDEIPFPDYGEIDIDTYAGKHAHTCVLRRYAVLMTSRGCPYRCVYCHVLFGKNFRYRSAGNVAQEFLELNQKYGIQDFLITDDIFNIRLGHAKDVLREIIKLKIDPRIYFPNGLRGDIIDDEFLDLMAEAGTVELVYAIEAGSDRIQKLIKKNLKLDRVERSIIETGKRKIVVNAFFMIGFPSETKEEVDTTVDLIARLIEYVHFPYVNIVRAYHGSALYKIAQELGYDEDFLMKHAMMPFGTQEAIESDHNFLPTAFLKEARLRVAAEFTRSDRMQKMLRIQMEKFTWQELVWKYATYFGSKQSRAERLLKQVLDSMDAREVDPQTIEAPVLGAIGLQA